MSVRSQPIPHPTHAPPPGLRPMSPRALVSTPHPHPQLATTPPPPPLPPPPCCRPAGCVLHGVVLHHLLGELAPPPQPTPALSPTPTLPPPYARPQPPTLLPPRWACTAPGSPSPPAWRAWPPPRRRGAPAPRARRRAATPLNLGREGMAFVGGMVAFFCHLSLCHCTHLHHSIYFESRFVGD